MFDRPAFDCWLGGAASLSVPGSDGTLVIDDPQYVPPAWRASAQASSDQLEVCRNEAAVDWAYLSPAALLEPGERTGSYRLGADELLVDSGQLEDLRGGLGRSTSG